MAQRDVTGFNMKFVSNVRSGKLCALRLLTRSCITDCLYLLPRTFWGNPTAECVDGNAHVVSLRNNVEHQKVRVPDQLPG